MSPAIHRADELVYRMARERDRVLWMVNGMKDIRDALRRGEDGTKEAAEYSRRKEMVDSSRARDAESPCMGSTGGAK